MTTEQSPEELLAAWKSLPLSIRTWVVAEIDAMAAKEHARDLKAEVLAKTMAMQLASIMPTDIAAPVSAGMEIGAKSSLYSAGALQLAARMLSVLSGSTEDPPQQQ